MSRIYRTLTNIRGGYTGSRHLANRAAVLDEQRDSLSQQISALETIIVSSPKKEAERRVNRHNTVPAPDDYYDAYSFRLSRGQEDLVRKERMRQLVLFCVLLTCLGGVLLWLFYQLSKHSVI